MKQLNRGMTLLEVLVALAIFATAAISVIRSTTQHTNTIAFLEEKTFASMVVDNQMAQVMLKGAPASSYSGSEQMAGRTWYWKVAPVKTAVGAIGAFDVTVYSDKEQKDSLLTVRSYVAK
ncbi:type II secretion system minor pseudopilin GspI [Vibrio sp. SCSIO 43137]|uniref:type II secretion system minor pseudopilin GspI n=1 Tax=Vibrio sp. SCSIO 43137 TaxID=3021011 RepID=UPI0023081AD4|nr:type II secretion system minor pseudopilin GspI [Vibrio sp. SCSIO 43137]WCE29805.1 type II secretion system minor pseudopilin GspI [Vibrio sp. SCSIO 43137]